MPRRGIIKKRKLVGDQKYGSTLVTKFITTVMKEGKRSTAEGIVYGAMAIVQLKTKEDPLKVFEKAMDNVRPMVETKYQVPVEVEIARSLSVGARWLIKYAEERGGKTMEDKLASEIIDALGNKGGAVKKREDTHKMAEANRAFAHYRW
jgi:small subunit ribosomal protein S7